MGERSREAARVLASHAAAAARQQQRTAVGLRQHHPGCSSSLQQPCPHPPKSCPPHFCAGVSAATSAGSCRSACTRPPSSRQRPSSPATACRLRPQLGSSGEAQMKSAAGGRVGGRDGSLRQHALSAQHLSKQLHRGVPSRSSASALLLPPLRAAGTAAAGAAAAGAAALPLGTADGAAAGGDAARLPPPTRFSREQPTAQAVVNMAGC